MNIKVGDRYYHGGEWCTVKRIFDDMLFLRGDDGCLYGVPTVKGEKG